MDTISSERRSKNMAAIKSKGMKPEMAVRKITHSIGFRYRLHRKDLPGKPDLVFPSRKKVIFVHGCFWHQHKLEGCKKSRLPKSNLDYWLPKLDRNVQRDVENRRALQELGWKTLIIWECELATPSKVEELIRNFLQES